MIGTILGWKFNNAPGICTRDGEITTWPDSLGPRPTVEQIEQWGVEYADLARKQRIKARAREVILAKLPEWKQANMTAHAVQLTRKLAAGTITEVERNILDQYETGPLAWVKAVRETSDAAERDGLEADQVVWP